MHSSARGRRVAEHRSRLLVSAATLLSQLTKDGTETMTLAGKKIAILIAPRGTEEPEFVRPKGAVEAAGAAVTVIGIETGKGQTNNSDPDPNGSYQIDNGVTGVSADDFDGLVIPGGCVGADKLRADDGITAAVRSFFEQQKPIGVICHGPWLLAEADVTSNAGPLNPSPRSAVIPKMLAARGSTRKW